MRTVTLIIVGLGFAVDHVLEANDAVFYVGVLRNTGVDNADGGVLTGDAFIVQGINTESDVSVVHERLESVFHFLHFTFRNANLLIEEY